MQQNTLQSAECNVKYSGHIRSQ